MNEYVIKMQIEAKDEAEKKAIGNSLLTIYKHLPTKELINIAEEIKKDPRVISKVRNVANNPIVKKLYRKKS